MVGLATPGFKSNKHCQSYSKKTMIEINIKLNEIKPGNVEMTMSGLAEGDTYTTNEANYADVIAGAVKNVRPSYGVTEVLQDIHIRKGK